MLRTSLRKGPMNPKARVLVLGATGQVGGALVPLLVADESVQVVAAARTPAKAEQFGSRWWSLISTELRRLPRP